MIHDFEIPQGNKLPKIRQKITLPGAVNMTAATAQLIYKAPEGEAVVRTAAIYSVLPTTAATTSFELEYGWITADTLNDGVFAFQWRVTLSDGTKLDLPSLSPTDEDEERVWQTFRVTPILT